MSFARNPAPRIYPQFQFWRIQGGKRGMRRQADRKQCGPETSRPPSGRKAQGGRGLPAPPKARRKPSPGQRESAPHSRGSCAPLPEPQAHPGQAGPNPDGPAQPRNTPSRPPACCTLPALSLSANARPTTLPIVSCIPSASPCPMRTHPGLRAGTFCR